VDALRTSHKALARRYSKLKQQVEAAGHQNAKNNSSKDSNSEQLRVMRQQLAEANRFLAQQQETNKQQAAQLQQARDDLAAAAEHCQAEQQDMQQQLSDMAAAVAAADAATRRAVRDEAAMLQALTHLVQQQAEEQDKVQTEKGQLKEQLTTAWAEVSRMRSDAAEVEKYVMTLKRKNASQSEMICDAITERVHAECKMAKMQLTMRDTNAKWQQYKTEAEQQLQTLAAWHQQLAGQDQASLAAPVAQLRRLLHSVDAARSARCCSWPLPGLQQLQGWVIGR
jgi:chromosome segregation ATPase